MGPAFVAHHHKLLQIYFSHGSQTYTLTKCHAKFFVRFSPYYRAKVIYNVMKVCPKCNSSYSDETLVYCPTDETELISDSSVAQADEVEAPVVKAAAASTGGKKRGRERPETENRAGKRLQISQLYHRRYTHCRDRCRRILGTYTSQTRIAYRDL